MRFPIRGIRYKTYRDKRYGGIALAFPSGDDLYDKHTNDEFGDDFKLYSTDVEFETVTFKHSWLYNAERLRYKIRNPPGKRKKRTFSSLVMNVLNRPE